MERKALSEKILVLGVDGMDPRLTSKFLAQGHMPNLQAIINRGICRQDLVMLGGNPTVTPPMWTTLATGANPGTHGITGFWNQDPDNLLGCIYNLDSRMCKAEQLWNVFAENGKKTLVWHWPGSSWPPSSDSPNLHVVEGTQPGAINMGVANVDWEKVVDASASFDEVRYLKHGEQHAGVGCIINDLDELTGKEKPSGEVTANEAADLVFGDAARTAGSIVSLAFSREDGEVALLGNVSYDLVQSPIKPAVGWSFAPEGAKEFTIITSGGLLRRPCLILPNDNGIYDRIAIYKTKKESEPLAVCAKGQLLANLTDLVQKDDRTIIANRSLKLINLNEDGSQLKLWISSALDTTNDTLWSPSELFSEITANVGHIPPISQVGGNDELLAKEVLIPAWEVYTQWQASSLRYFIDQNRYSVIFSHLHNVDHVGHQLWHFGKNQPLWPEKDENFYHGIMLASYEQTDRYLGRFLDLLDDGWSIFIVSDHGLIISENEPPLIGEPGGVSIRVMQELGYTVLKTDANGQETREVDWSKTRAVANRGNHIWLNLKGRQPEGIVTEEERYELERQIITDLYGYKDPETGLRAISLALRNKDAVYFGMNGPECGDIIFFMEEGFNRIHADAFGTQQGYWDTSVSPIFVAAGQGLKQGVYTDRIIRENDLAPTLAVLGGVRFPAQCEGAPIYQIFSEEI